MGKLKFFLPEREGAITIELMEKQIAEGKFKLKTSDGAEMSIHEIFLKTQATCILIENFDFCLQKEDYGWSVKKYK